MTETQPPWAILRQLVLATDDAPGEGKRLGDALRLPAGFADPTLEPIRVADCTMPVGPQKFLEVVGPMDDTSFLSPWLAKRGGGGFCLSVQVSDVWACRERATAAGVRFAADQDVFGHRIVQLRPADVGILLELDGISDPTAWFWDDLTPGPRADAVVDDIVGVRIGTPDPAERAAQWAHIMGLELTSATAFDVSGCTFSFVPREVSQLVGADFLLADGAQAPDSLDLLGLEASFLSRARA